MDPSHSNQSPDAAPTEPVDSISDGRGQSGFPSGLSQPALRAFAQAGYTTLEQFATITEDELLTLHGVGPKAIRILKEALARRGLSFADRTPRM